MNVNFLCRLAGVSLTLLLAACGSKETPKATAETSSAAVPTPAPQPILGAWGKALATAEGAKGTMEVNELKRITGGMVHLKVTFHTSEDDTTPAFGDYNFGDMVGSLGGVHLIDPVHKKKYFVLRDTEGKCLCSTGIGRLRTGKPFAGWARFPAPPEDVTRVSVMVPHFPPMDEIEISR